MPDIDDQQTELAPVLKPEQDADDRFLERAGELAEQAGFQPVDDTMFTFELGVLDDADVIGPPPEPFEHDQCAAALELGRQLSTAVAHGEMSSFIAAGRARGLSLGKTKKLRRLVINLCEAVQARVLNGQAAHLSISKLWQLIDIHDEQQQLHSFEQMCASAPRRRQAPNPSRSTSDLPRVRVVAYFNPELMLQKRRSALLRRARLEAAIAALNDKGMSEEQLRRRAESILREHSLSTFFNIKTERSPRAAVRAELKVAKWRARRRYDGISVLVGHPDLPQTAAELAQLYRSKDTVEKDFQVIKSLVKLRPVWHHTDVKVRAHVTLCMLALLLERTLRQRLKDFSVERALEILATCTLQQFRGHYSLTQLQPEQSKILRQLDLERLGDEGALSQTLSER